MLARDDLHELKVVVHLIDLRVVTLPVSDGDPQYAILSTTLCQLVGPRYLVMITLTAIDTKTKRRHVPLTPELTQVFRDLYKVRYLG